MLSLHKTLRYTQADGEYYLTLDADGTPLRKLPLYFGKECRIHGLGLARRLVHRAVVFRVLELLLLLAIGGVIIVKYPGPVVRLTLVGALIVILMFAIYSIIDLQLEDKDDNRINLTREIIIVGALPVRLVE